MGVHKSFLSVLVTQSFLGFSVANLCPSDFVPYSCTSCIEFAKDTPFEEACDLNTTLVKVESSKEIEMLQTYMEVFSEAIVWVNSTKTELNNNCSGNCCSALQLVPLVQLVQTECSTRLSAICSMDVGTLNVLENSHGSGDGGNTLINADIEVTANGTSSSEKMQSLPYGEAVSLTCSQEDGVSVKWYINGEIQEVDDAESTFLINKFTVPGFYQCQIDEEIRTVTLCGIDTTPGSVEILSAFPLSQTELSVLWYPPSFLGTSHPLLLRYDIYYTTNDVLDINSALVLSVLPQLKNGSISNGIGKIILPNLKVGQSYLITVVAHSKGHPTSAVKFITKASTYGRAPTTNELDLKVERLRDDKNLVISWKPALLELPLGPVALYEVQYRDAKQSVITTVHVQPETTFLVVHDVANVNDYEVRIAILVEVSQDPLQHERSTWSEWKRVNGTTSTIPSEGPINPTISSSSDNLELIIAAVLLPLAVALIVILLLLLAAARVCRKSRGGGYTIREKENFSRLSLEEEKTDSANVG